MTSPEASAEIPSEELDQLPVLPLRNTVLFPGTLNPITVGRAESLQMIDENLSGSRVFGVFTQRDPNVEAPAGGDLFDVGVTANIVKLQRDESGGMLLLVQALHRIAIREIVQSEPYLKARVEILESKTPTETDDLWVAKLANFREASQQFLALTPGIPAEAGHALVATKDPGALTDFLASNLSIEVAQRQQLLEELDVAKRVSILQEILDNQIRIYKLQQKLRADVKSEFDESQKRAYLREQIRAIQRELGEADSGQAQVDELRIRLEQAELPEAAMQHAEGELKRLETIPPASPEHSVITTYLETMAELPWNRLSDDNLDLDKAQQILDRDHFGLEKVKTRLIEYLAVRKLNPNGKGPILCLSGPPGVGKTSLGKSIASALGREFARISLGGIRDEAEIRGHRRTYIGSMPGRLIQELRRLGTRNPVIMLDEVDKLGADFRGDPASALLEVLDPWQNHEFVDRYLDVPFDLSQVIFIATANTLDPIPRPLLDRMEVIEIAGYTTREKLQIAKRYAVPRQLEENGIDARQCRWTDDGLMAVIEDYTREAGVRNLERMIGGVCRHVAAEVARDPGHAVEITPERIVEILGVARFVRESKLRVSEPGVVTGLAYTPSGGEILHIEAIRYPGSGKITLTGQLGDVMKESVQAAHSLVKSYAVRIGIDPKMFASWDIHVHVPAGAVPKDGPSAGIAMFTALASLFSDRPVSKDTAMTGELSLRGLVLPIGGLKEKSLAALSAGIKRILIPQGNLKDVAELPEEVREKLEIVPVETADDVLRLVLPGAVASSGAEPVGEKVPLGDR